MFFRKASLVFCTDLGYRKRCSRRQKGVKETAIKDSLGQGCQTYCPMGWIQPTGPLFSLAGYQGLPEFGWCGLQLTVGPVAPLAMAISTEFGSPLQLPANPPYTPDPELCWIPILRSTAVPRPILDIWPRTPCKQTPCCVQAQCHWHSGYSYALAWIQSVSSSMGWIWSRYRGGGGGWCPYSNRTFPL